MDDLKTSLNKLKESGLFKLVGLIAIIVTAIVSIAVYILSNNYTKIINQLESSIERLTPSSDNSGNIDLSQFFVYRNKVVTESIPKESVYNPINQFYFAKNKYWSYREMNPIEFIHFINKTRTSREEYGIEDNSSHVWYSNFKINLNDPEYQNIVDNEVEYFVIDTISNIEIVGFNKKPDDLKQYIKLTIYNNKKSCLKRRDARGFNVMDSISFRDIGFKANVSTFIDIIFDDLFSNLPHAISHTEISEMNLNENWFFLSSLSVFGSKNIHKGEKRTVYSFNEWYILYSEQFTYFLEVQTPGYEPIRRGDQFKELNIWLSNFRVILR